MPFPKSFHRLVIFGKLYQDEIWNTSLSIVPTALGEVGMPAVDDATISAVWDDVLAWFSKPSGVGAPNFISKVTLDGIKLNRIGTNGLYQDPTAKTFPAPFGVVGTSSQTPAPQLTTVVTLRTAIERGAGSKGRMYLPPTAGLGALGTDGRLAPADALVHADTVKFLIEKLNTRYTAIGRVGVASAVGSGRFEHCTHVTAGRVVDTRRSRRGKLKEDPQSVTIA
jgi:hypothetical protein